MEKQKLQEAQEELRRILKDQPRHADAGRMMAVVQDLLDDRKLDQELVPELAVSLDELMTTDLGPNEAFLASRVNGLWSIRDILTIAPFEQDECLAIFSRLIKRGILKTSKLTQGRGSAGHPCADLLRIRRRHAYRPRPAADRPAPRCGEASPRPPSSRPRSSGSRKSGTTSSSGWRPPRISSRSWPPPRRPGTWPGTEAEAARKEADQVRATLQENGRGGDAILQDLQAARQEAEEAKAAAAKAKAESEELRGKLSAVPAEGDLVVLSQEVQPARPINLNRVVPRLKSSGLFAGRPKGVVVVNVLINEKGEVVASRLIQGLPGDGPEVNEAGEACVEAAKKLVFDPAASKDGKTRFKVWQGVGFYLD